MKILDKIFDGAIKLKCKGRKITKLTILKNMDKQILILQILSDFKAIGHDIEDDVMPDVIAVYDLRNKIEELKRMEDEEMEKAEALVGAEDLGWNDIATIFKPIKI